VIFLYHDSILQEKENDVTRQSFPCIEIDQAIIYLLSNGTLITSDLAFARDKSRDTFRLKVVVE
jgi:hypothetical protein